MPCSTPIKLTSSTQRQLSSEIAVDAAAAGDAGIVADHMDIAEGLERRLGRTLDADGIGNIAEHAAHIGSDIVQAL